MIGGEGIGIGGCTVIGGAKNPDPFIIIDCGLKNMLF